MPGGLILHDLQIELEVEARYSRRLEAQLHAERRRQNMLVATVCMALGALLVSVGVFAWIILAHNS